MAATLLRLEVAGGLAKRNLLAATDRAGHRSLKAIGDAGHTAIITLLPMMALGAMPCNDGHATYERIAKGELAPHFALSYGRGIQPTARSHHINNVNVLIGGFRAFMRSFCKPASKNLAAYNREHAAQNNTDRSYLDAI